MQKLIKNRWIILIPLLFVLIPQAKQSAVIFSTVENSVLNKLGYSSGFDTLYLYPWLFAIGLDLSILLFTVHGEKRIAFLYLIATFITDILFYYHQNTEVFKGYLAEIIGVHLSILLAGTIYSFSHLFHKLEKEDFSKQSKDIINDVGGNEFVFKEKQDESIGIPYNKDLFKFINTEKPDSNGDIIAKEAVTNSIKAIKDFSKRVKKKETKPGEARQNKPSNELLNCPACKSTFETSAQRNGHVSAHKTRGEWTAEHVEKLKEMKEKEKQRAKA